MPESSSSSFKATSTTTANSTSNGPHTYYQAPAQVIYDLSVARDPSSASDSTWQDATESSLEWILSLKPRAGEGADDKVHWYCGRYGAKECYESSVLLVRLLAFKRNGEVGQWRQQFDELMLSCSACVEAYQHAKHEFKERYLMPLKPERTVQAFSDAIERAEANSVISALTSAGLHQPPEDQHSTVVPSSINLSAVPPAVIHNCLVNSLLFQRDDILSTLASGLPVSTAINLPTTVSPGLLVLRMSEYLPLREWVQIQLDTCQTVTPEQYLANGLGAVMDSHLDVLASRDRKEDSPTVIHLRYVASRRAFWDALASCLAVLSADTIRANLLRTPVSQPSTTTKSNLDVVHLVGSHLGDQDPDHLPSVLTCWRILLERLGPHVWAAGEERFEEVVLHAILDNPTFEAIFLGEEQDDQDDAMLGVTEEEILNWLPPFLASVAHSPHLFTNSLAIVTSTFLDRLQQLRFPISARSRAITLAFSILSDVFISGDEPAGKTVQGEIEIGSARFPHAMSAFKVLDMHAGFIARLAFDPRYAATDGEWAEASTLARSFVRKIMERDSKRIKTAIYMLGRYSDRITSRKEKLERKSKEEARAVQEKRKPVAVHVPDEPKMPPVINFSSTLWDKTYSTLKDTDLRGIGIVLRGASPICHLEKLSGSVFATRDLIRPQMKALNKALEATRDRLIPLLVGMVDEKAEVLLEFLRTDGMSEHVALLLCSPIEDIHNAVQGIVKQAFDVMTRREVFKSLLSCHPDRTIHGLLAGLKGFELGSTTLPETSSMAKRLVRCLSDILDVLCATSDGLLRDSTFAAKHMNDDFRRRLAKLWSQMCKVLALLNRLTPKWATFLQPDDMTDWMREALIFGIDLVNQFDTLTMAVAGTLSEGLIASGSQLGVFDVSVISLQLISDLNAPLEDLLGWLRLNDLDLLQSTVDLIRAMLGLFARSSAASLDTRIVDRIRHVLERTVRKDASRSYILREDQIGELRKALDLAVGDKVDSGTQETQKEWWAKLQAKSQAQSGKSNRKEQAPTTTIKSASGNLPKVTSGVRVSAPVKVVPPSGKKGPNFGVPVMKNAVRPRGVPWTTYSSKKAADSSDESSSDDEPGDTKLGGLAMLAQAQKPTIKTVERRTVKMLNGDSTSTTSSGKRVIGKPIGVRAQAEADKAAQMARLRGTPDLSQLHRQVLQWDPEYTGDLPPSMTQPLRSVATAFDSPDAYYTAFEPLLLTECWDQIKNGKIEAAKEGQVVVCTLAGRQAVNDFTDVFVTVAHSDMPDRMWFGESDLILLRQGPRQVLAKVQAFGRKREFSEMTLRCQLGNDKTNAGAGLVARTKWEMVKLYNLSTIHREYAALQSVAYLDLFDDIVSPRPSPVIPTDSRAIAKTVTAYQVNQPQAEAIHGALKTQGFSLIQGPPGTGKTKTILGLIGAFIDSRPRVAAPIVAGRPTDPLAVQPVAKLLLCAPSNAAVDEVAKRLKDGIKDGEGKHFVPNIVRIGADLSIDIAVKDVFIDELVERALSGDAANSAAAAGNDAQSNMIKMRAEVDALRAARDAKSFEIQAVENNSALRSDLHAELKQIKSEIFKLSQKLDSEKDKAQRSKRAMDAQQRQMRLKILSEADVICATLSGAGHDYMAQLPFDFEIVIIDEAAQSVELSSLIPLKYGCRRCILVGDPLQLPPTVTSVAAKRAGYDRSLFVRMMERGRGSHLLSIQYRMHPNISAFPSTAFYQSRLTDGPGMDTKTTQPWHATSLFPPYAFFHVRNGNEVAGRHHSWSNPAEAAVALAIYERLQREFPKIDFDYRIGIVTPYKGQVFELKRTFRKKYGDEIVSKISFNTVDGFQGQEKDIIILSCVRGGSVDKGVGFLADTRRMNVALTRARSSLFVLGDSNKLRQNKYWSNLVDDAQARGLLTHVDVSTFRSLAVAAPPSIKTVPSKSKAKAIEISTSSLPSAQTPQAISAQSAAAKATAAIVKLSTSSPSTNGSASVKRRIAESMDLDMHSKKVKTEESEPTGISSKPPAAPAQPKPVLPPRPKPKPSLFMPSKKRPPPTNTKK